jgi:hypothetical protein
MPNNWRKRPGLRITTFKDPIVRKRSIQTEIRDRGLSEGLVAVLCCMETCRSVKLVEGKNRPRLVFARRLQRVVYYYFLDPEFGLVYVRLQTWFPFTIQAYVNGHEWLGRKMAQGRLGFIQQDNAFIQLDDRDAAQRLADRFPHLRWVKILSRWAKRFNPLLGRAWLKPGDYYWVIDQAEYSTDVLFRSKEDFGSSVSAFARPCRVEVLGRRYPYFLWSSSAHPLRRRDSQ